MHEFLRDLRNKSERYKKNFSLAVSGGVTLIIFLFWISATYADFSKISLIPKNAPDFITPFSTFKDGVAQVYQSMQSEYGQAKEKVKSEALNAVSTSTPLEDNLSN
jgi:hypothetical protein